MPDRLTKNSGSRVFASDTTRRRRIRDALCAQGVHKRLVVAVQFDVVEASAARQRVVRDIEHMVRLLVAHVVLEQLHLIIHVLDETRVACKNVEGADAGAVDRAGALGQFSLAFSEDFVILILHSKFPSLAGACFCTDAL